MIVKYNGEKHYNHGCTEYAEFKKITDDKYKCIVARVCSNCWQVGHNGNQTFFEVGEIYTYDEIKHYINE